jgi:rod shape-determining protein MreB
MIEMFKKLRGMFSTDLSIDLGTANTLIYMRGKGIVLNEPSVVAIRNEKNGSKSIVTVGTEAKMMLGRTPQNISATRPMKDGVIADFMVTEKMLQAFIGKVHKSKYFFKPSPRVLICVPCGSTQVERRAIKESAYGAGARNVYLIEEPVAAAVGADLPVSDAKASMVVDIGGGTTEIAILSLNGIVTSDSVRIGGDRFDDAIIDHVRKKYGIVIGEATAEKIKKEIGSAYPSDETLELEVSGRHLAEGIPKKFTVNSTDVLSAFQESFSGIIRGIMGVLEQSPPELASDISERGMVLTGGGSLIKDFDKLIMEETGVPVSVAKEPLNCVAIGGGIALETIKDHNGDLFWQGE